MIKERGHHSVNVETNPSSLGDTCAHGWLNFFEMSTKSFRRVPMVLPQFSLTADVDKDHGETPVLSVGVKYLLIRLFCFDSDMKDVFIRRQVVWSHYVVQAIHKVSVRKAKDSDSRAEQAQA